MEQEKRKKLRKQMKDKREALKDEQVTDLSQMLTEAVVSHYDFLKAKDVLIYRNTGKEARTDGIIAYAFMLGKRVFIPRVEGKAMDFYEIHDIHECVAGFRGISEPPFGAEKFVFATEAQEEDVLMILPGLSFDKQGNRLGYGGGYYDNYLKDNPACRKMGIGYDFQIVGEIPVCEWDQPVDIVITEKRVLLPE